MLYEVITIVTNINTRDPDVSNRLRIDPVLQKGIFKPIVVLKEVVGS